MTDDVVLTPEERHALNTFLGECCYADVQAILSRNPALANQWMDLNRTLDRLYRRLSPVRPS